MNSIYKVEVVPLNHIYQDDFGGFYMDDEMLHSMKLCLMRDEADREAAMEGDQFVNSAGSHIFFPLYSKPSINRINWGGTLCRYIQRSDLSDLSCYTRKITKTFFSIQT